MATSFFKKKLSLCIRREGRVNFVHFQKRVILKRPYITFNQYTQYEKRENNIFSFQNYYTDFCDTMPWSLL